VVWLTVCFREPLLFSNLHAPLEIRVCQQYALRFRGVAQFGSASALGAEGRRFESGLPDVLLVASSAVERGPYKAQVTGSIPVRPKEEACF
jgi:hypothetical protein